MKGVSEWEFGNTKGQTTPWSYLIIDCSGTSVRRVIAFIGRRWLRPPAFGEKRESAAKQQ